MWGNGAVCSLAPFRQKGTDMKRLLCIMLSIGLFSCLTACHAGTEQPSVTNMTDPAERQTEADNTEQQTDSEVDDIRLLTLEKTLHTYYEWVEDSDLMLVRSENACVTLGQKDTEAFPALAEALGQIAVMQENTMLDEFDNLVAFAKEEQDINPDGFETYVSTLNVHVRRADNLVVSLYTDSYSHYGQIENFRVLGGSNFDPQSGRMLQLNDVVDVNNDLAIAVENAIRTPVWSGDFSSETAVQDYFANTPYDGFNWTVDYYGITFYFSAGDISDDGNLTATVLFEEYPKLFNEKYVAAPTEYAVEIPLDSSIHAELDTNGAPQTISVSGWYNEERDHYMDYGIYINGDEQCYEECFVYRLHPYFVKTENGNYVYLFCEDFQEGWREMQLVVFSLNADGSITKAGEMNVSPYWSADNQFIMPTDPGHLILNDAGSDTEPAEYAVGDDGMPVGT